MAGIYGSSIQPWLDLELDLHTLDFKLQDIPAVNFSCLRTDIETDFIQINCTHVCNSSSQLSEYMGMKNMLMCGLWVTLVTLKNSFADPDKYNDGPVTPDVFEHYQKELDRFATLGLDQDDTAYALAATGAVSTILSTSLLYNNIWTYQGDSAFGLCSQQYLFPDRLLSGYHFPFIGFKLDPGLPERLRTCVTAICAPMKLNPDLGGVGVSITYHTRAAS